MDTMISYVQDTSDCVTMVGISSILIRTIIIPIKQSDQSDQSGQSEQSEQSEQSDHSDQ